MTQQQEDCNSFGDMSSSQGEGRNMQEVSVSDRLAALKMKLNQSRTDGTAAHNEEVRGQKEVGDDGQLAALQEQLEKEVAKNNHILGLYEEQREELEQLQMQRDSLQRESEERSNAMKKTYDDMVHEMQRQLDARSEHDEVMELRNQIKEMQCEIERLQSESRETQASNSGVEDVEQALVKSTMELKFAKDQLHRLKSQMITSQEEQEEEIRWRVEAEVTSRLEQMGIHPDGEMPVRDEQLVHDLEIALDRIQQAEKEVDHWKEALEVKDTELKNMQIALGDLSYESEAAEKLRVQVRSLEAAMRSKDDEVEQSKIRCQEYESQTKKALEQLGQEKKKAAAAREAEGAARQEMISLQVSYNDLALKMQGGDNRKTYDRSFVVKLLKDMASLRHSQAIKKAIQVLSLTDEEQTFVLGDNSSSLANTWVTFLESQVEDDSV